MLSYILFSIVEITSNSYLIYTNAKLGQIRSVSLNKDVESLDVIKPIIGLSRPVALDYDRKEGYIYYSDASQYMIGRRKINGSQNEPFITKSK